MQSQSEPAEPPKDKEEEIGGETAKEQDIENAPARMDSVTSETPPFAMGDHVYHWCSVMGIPAVYQHHGIVMDVFDDTIRIADFSNERGKKKNGSVRMYDVPLVDSKYWHKVLYEASWLQRHTYRSGTCTAAHSDAPALVRSRVQFLLDHPDVLPCYDSVRSNCECVALWCKTGTWATLQAASWLTLTAAGQVKSAMMVSGAAAATQVTVPSAGLWGFLGFTTHVSLLSTQPLLLPAIVTYGVVSAGTPAIWLAMARNHWRTTTEMLNQSFWENAIDNPEVFVECITYWSSDGMYNSRDRQQPFVKLEESTTKEKMVKSENDNAQSVSSLKEPPVDQSSGQGTEQVVSKQT